MSRYLCVCNVDHGTLLQTLLSKHYFSRYFHSHIFHRRQFTVSADTATRLFRKKRRNLPPANIVQSSAVPHAELAAQRSIIVSRGTRVMQKLTSRHEIANHCQPSPSTPVAFVMRFFRIHRTRLFRFLSCLSVCNVAVL